MGYILSLFVFIFGTIVGSFLSVLVHRHGYQEKRRPRSECASCLKTLSWYEMIPVLSFLFLRGKCKSCGSKLSSQDPIIEISTGLLFLGALLTTPILYNEWFLPILGMLFVFWSSFLVLTVYDLKHTLVPIPFVGVLIGSSILVRILESFYFKSVLPLYDGFIAATLLSGFILVLVFVTRGKGMGVGDIYVTFALGMLFGVYRGLEVIALSFWIGAIIGIALIIIKKVSPSFRLPGTGVTLTMKSEVPFVPFLFIAALVGAFTTFSPLTWIGTLF